MATILSRDIGIDRKAVGRAIDALVALLDQLDGDSDFELGGDDFDYSPGCDEPNFERGMKGDKRHGPGCRYSDEGEEDDWSGGDVCDEPHDPDEGI
ncbi:MAG: hypothetical protein R3E02_01870 [Blastomonas sp.]